MSIEIGAKINKRAYTTQYRANNLKMNVIIWPKTTILLWIFDDGVKYFISYIVWTVYVTVYIVQSTCIYIFGKKLCTGRGGVGAFFKKLEPWTLENKRIYFAREI